MEEFELAISQLKLHKELGWDGLMPAFLKIFDSHLQLHGSIPQGHFQPGVNLIPRYWYYQAYSQQWRTTVSYQLLKKHPTDLLVCLNSVL